MENTAKIFIIFSIFLIIGVSMTGCSDSPDSSGISDTVVATTTNAPLFTAGDIVRSATGGDSPAWLVVGYDSATDSYTRALIYKNSDGSWGYRVNAKTEKSERVMMEKVYTVKMAQVAVASVPTNAPTIMTTDMTPIATRTAAITKVATTATTTTIQSNARPSIKEMDPDEGEAGTTVSTEITGTGFLSNLTAALHRSGEDSIIATKVSWYSSSSVTCTFDLPNTTMVGAWDIVVTNPNRLSGEYTNYFTVRGNKTVN